MLYTENNHSSPHVITDKRKKNNKLRLYSLYIYKPSLFFAISKLLSVLSGNYAAMGMMTSQKNYWGGILELFQDVNVSSKILVVSKKFSGDYLSIDENFEILNVPSWKYSDQFDIYYDEIEDIKKLLTDNFINKLIEIDDHYNSGFCLGIDKQKFVYCFPNLKVFLSMKLFGIGKNKIKQFKTTIIDELRFILEKVI